MATIILTGKSDCSSSASNRSLHHSLPISQFIPRPTELSTESTLVGQSRLQEQDAKAVISARGGLRGVQAQAGRGEAKKAPEEAAVL